MNIFLLGAGAWGTALAVGASERHAVSLWARDAAQCEAMRGSRENKRYLPGVALPPSLVLQHLEAQALAAELPQADLVVIATPMSGLRRTLDMLSAATQPMAWLCKGFEPAQTPGQPSSPGPGLMAHEVCAQVAPQARAGALSGPSFALEVARRQPTALVAASRHAAVRQALVDAFHGPALRVYGNDDLVGVGVGGAVKNVLAIATGLCDGLGLGLNARAALITRGLAEMTRFGVALGARSETFMGLSGLGDLVLTATGDLSRNRRVGALLAQGRSLQQALDSLGHVAEGVSSAHSVLQRATQLGVEMPIVQSVVALLDGTTKPADAVMALMGRSAALEGA
jgi:glycerol-3-phosphate dehydrogenase (NAD(P)+)